MRFLFKSTAETSTVPPDHLVLTSPPISSNGRDMARLLVGVALCCLHAACALQLPPLTPIGDAVRDTHYISATTSWLVPGHVMLGRYPGSCPSRPCSLAAQGARVTAIREHAVDTFVCLQSELPPQDDVNAWPSEGIGGQSNNVDAPQTARFQPYFDDARGATFVHYGIDDRSVPASVEALNAAVDDLCARVLRGDCIYIHCWGGRGMLRRASPPP